MKYVAYTLVSVVSLAVIGLAVLFISDVATGPFEPPPSGKEKCESYLGGRWNEFAECECTDDLLNSAASPEEYAKYCGKPVPDPKANGYPGDDE